MTPEQLRRLLVTFPWAQWSETLRAEYEPLYRDLLARGGQAGAVDAGGVFTADDPTIAAFSDRYVGDLIVELQDTTKDRVSRLIEDAITAAQAAESGPTPFELGTAIRDAVREEFAGYERWRADRIARTETARVYNHGALFAYHQNDITHVIVSDGNHPGSCEECDAVDGEIWTIEEAQANPLEHPQCVRSFQPATAEDLAAAEAEE